jgi:REP element-mobilizing transposase RayT
MPRPPRIHAPGAMYHVTLRGNHRQDIFFTRGDRHLLTSLIGQVIEGCGAQVHAYCYMPNHIHLLMRVDQTPLSKIMLLIASPYARKVQARMETTGHFFERRYHAVLVDTNAYLVTLLRYIHHNPVRAGLVATPDDYQWSSHHAYLETRLEPWVTTAFALGMLDCNRERAIAAYKALVACPLTTSPLAECNARDPRILGSDAFANNLLGDRWNAQFSTTVPQLIDDACAKFCVTASELESTSRRADVTSARLWIAEQAIAAGICSRADVARCFNRYAPSFRLTLRRRRSQAER